jgi:hypothetical protein
MANSRVGPAAGRDAARAGADAAAGNGFDGATARIIGPRVAVVYLLSYIRYMT